MSSSLAMLCRMYSSRGMTRPPTFCLYWAAANEPNDLILLERLDPTADEMTAVAIAVASRDDRRRPWFWLQEEDLALAWKESSSKVSSISPFSSFSGSKAGWRCRDISSRRSSLSSNWEMELRMSDIRAISGARSVKTALEASARAIHVCVSDDRVGGSVLLRIVSSLLVAVVLTLCRPSRNRATPVWISSAGLVLPTNRGFLERSRGPFLSFVFSTEVHMDHQTKSVWLFSSSMRFVRKKNFQDAGKKEEWKGLLCLLLLRR